MVHQKYRNEHVNGISFLHSKKTLICGRNNHSILVYLFIETQMPQLFITSQPKYPPPPPITTNCYQLPPPLLLLPQTTIPLPQLPRTVAVAYHPPLSPPIASTSTVAPYRHPTSIANRHHPPSLDLVVVGGNGRGDGGGGCR